MSAWHVESGPHKYVPQGKSVHWHDGGWYTGHLIQAECPICKFGKVVGHLRTHCGLTDAELDVRLEHFKPLSGKKEARDAAGYLLSLTPFPSGFVTFWGDYGRGKTMLLQALVNDFCLAKVQAVYAKPAEVLADLKETFNDKANKTEGLLSSYSTSRVLALDEIDRFYDTPWATDIIFRLLDERYRRRKELLTIMATNRAPDKFDRELEYLASRMKEGMVVHVGGDDVRPGVARKEQR
jgi:DNA replication protein DnaC